MERITSRTNPLVAHLRKLGSSHSYRAKTGEYLGDGGKLLDEALRWGAELETVACTPGISLPALPAGVRAVEVPEGRVALTVPVDDDLGVPPGVSAGELLAAYEVDEDGVQLLAGDVRVLSAPEGGAGMLSAGSITVAVAPDDVARMLAASAAGSLRLALPGERALEVAEGEQSAPASVPAEDDQTEADDEVAPGQGATEGVDES